MNNLYEALEICLQDIEKGADIETVLFRYPELADELRPILEASMGAKSMAVATPSPEVIRRNRARVLQHAARIRESKVKTSQRIWLVSLRRFAVTLAVLTMLFVSGTRLVSASSNTLPGDNLYPVKRTWEGVRLFFTFNGPEREALELEHENERLHELNELVKEGRSADVEFNGLVTSQNGNEWVVAGVQVLISGQTDIRGQGIGIGSPVEVKGITQADGTVLASRLKLLSSDAILPEVEDGHEFEVNENNSGPGSGEEGPRVEETETPGFENENSGSSNSGSNENQNEKSNENENESRNSNENSGNDNVNEGNEQSNENSGEESNKNENEKSNENSSGGGENSGSGNENGEGD